MLRVNISVEKIEIEADEGADVASLIEMTRSIVQMMRLPSQAAPLQILNQKNGDGARPHDTGQNGVTSGGNQAHSPPRHEQEQPAQEIPIAPKNTKVSASKSKQADYVEWALLKVGHPATVREVNETIFTLPGYASKSSNHMEVMGLVLRVNKHRFTKTEDGLWVPRSGFRTLKDGEILVEAVENSKVSGPPMIDFVFQALMEVGEEFTIKELIGIMEKNGWVSRSVDKVRTIAAALRDDGSFRHEGAGRWRYIAPPSTTETDTTELPMFGMPTMPDAQTSSEHQAPAEGRHHNEVEGAMVR